MSQSRNSVFDSPAAHLRALLDETVDAEQLWSADDLRDIFSHQWTAPLALDLGALGEAQAGRISALASAKGLLLKSFGDLLRHENPPLPLLQLTKDFAKRCLNSPLSTVPHDIARALYFTSIAAALDRCGCRITTLGDKEIAEGISWSLSRDWLVEDAAKVLSSGLTALKLSGEQDS